MTGTGRDRIGIVKDMTGLILEEEGNILDSKMSKLSGNFAMMLLVDLPDSKIPDLKEKLKRCQDYLALTINCNEVLEEGRPNGFLNNYRKISIEVEGADHPGIIHSITQYLSYLGVNVQTLHSSCEPAPWGGSTLFKMQANVAVPELIKFEDLEKKLQEMEQQLAVDIKVNQII